MPQQPLHVVRFTPADLPTVASGSAPTLHNRLLALLPGNEAARLQGHLERVPAVLGTVLAEPGESMPHIHFPESCIASIVNPTDGGLVEVGTVGNEGMVGLSALLDADAMPSRIIWQVEGTTLRMPAALLREAFDTLPVFRALLLRYTHAFLVQVAQTASCNRKHDIDQRCARWLLMTHDRVLSDTFGLTQRLLGVMLGVHRPAVTLSAQTLARAGLIRYTRGSITIVDRAGLEAVSCECHGIVRDHFTRLLGPPPNQNRLSMGHERSTAVGTIA
ncbi:MAG: Crp/Fnr family transcriptional regulator [Gemmatimonadetes bacterium]|jgi:CRP-like cAMP-binding protein|nr:Crp/Fnr family transcriptional regulator [Gemmatimonadota bacterium]